MDIMKIYQFALEKGVNNYKKAFCLHQICPCTCSALSRAHSCSECQIIMNISINKRKK